MTPSVPGACWWRCGATPTPPTTWGSFDSRLWDEANTQPVVKGFSWSVQVTIRDDDVPGLVISPAQAEHSEPPSTATTTYTVGLAARPSGPVTVTPALVGPASITMAPAALTFTPESYRPRAVTYTYSPNAAGGDAEAVISHSARGGSYDGIDPRDRASQVHVRVRDSTGRSRRVMLEVSPASLNEDRSGTVRVVGRLDLSARGEATTVTVSVAGASATAGADFAAVKDFALVVPAGRIESDPVRVELGPVDDKVVEGDETLLFKGLVPDADLAVEAAELTILDNDAVVRLEAAPDRVPEAAPGEEEGDGAHRIVVTARLMSGERDRATELTLALEDVTATRDADYTATDPGTVTIAPGTTAVAATFTLTPVDDDVNEGNGETLRVVGLSARGVAVSPAEVTIVDDDTWDVELLVDGVATTTLEVLEADAEVTSERLTVKLGSQPATSVTVTPSVGDNPDVTVSGAMTFTPTTWGAAQVVTVTVAPDDDGRTTTRR